MVYNYKCRKCRKYVTIPLVFLFISLVVVSVTLALVAMAQRHDTKWNDRLDFGGLLGEIRAETMRNGTSEFCERDFHKFYRDTWMKKAFIGISSFLLIATVIHVSIYLVYHEEHYRYNFALIFTGIALLLYFSAGAFLIASTIVNNDHYKDINELAVNKSLLANATILPLFRICQAADDEGEQEDLIENETVLTEAQVTDFRRRADDLGVCQLTTLKFATGALSLINVLILCGVILTTRSKKSRAEILLNAKRDLDFDPDDEEWGEVVSTYQPGRARRRTELEPYGLPTLDEIEASRKFRDPDSVSSVDSNTLSTGTLTASTVSPSQVLQLYQPRG